jgi:hypothetical protein
MSISIISCHFEEFRSLNSVNTTSDSKIAANTKQNFDRLDFCDWLKV